MSSQISTPVGVPAELNWTLPSSMVPSSKFELRVQPYGQSNFNPGNAIRIVLPQMQRTVLNTQTGYLLGSVTFTGAATVAGFVLGSMYSMFSRQVIRAGSGYVLETIDNPSLLVNALLNMTLNPSERLAMSNSFGFTGGVSNIGPSIVGANVVVPFAIPLVGLMNLTKMLPSWNGNLEIELTCAPISDLFSVSGFAGATAPNSYTISNLEYVVEALELAPQGPQLLQSSQ